MRRRALARDARLALLPAAAFLVALLAAASVGGGDPAPARPAGASIPPASQQALPSTLVLADVPALPAPHAARPRRAPSPVAMAPSPARPSPTATPTAAPVVEATPVPSSPAPPAPQPAAPAPTPAPSAAPPQEFDNSGSGPGFEDDGVTP